MLGLGFRVRCWVSGLGFVSAFALSAQSGCLVAKADILRLLRL